jgi:hypothetical protein
VLHFDSADPAVPTAESHSITSIVAPDMSTSCWTCSEVAEIVIMLIDESEFFHTPIAFAEGSRAATAQSFFMMTM